MAFVKAFGNRISNVKVWNNLPPPLNVYSVHFESLWRYQKDRMESSEWNRLRGKGSGKWGFVGLLFLQIHTMPSASDFWCARVWEGAGRGERDKIVEDGWRESIWSPLYNWLHFSNSPIYIIKAVLTSVL